MAPDFEKKREPAKVTGYFGHCSYNNNKQGMILLKCRGNPFTDYYHHGQHFENSSTTRKRNMTDNFQLYTCGNTVSESGTSAVTSLSTRSLASNTLRQSSRRFNQPSAQQQLPQTQQQQQPQRRSPARIPLASLSSVTVRNSDELVAANLTTQEVCDSSNDSGLGFEERQQHLGNSSTWNNGAAGEEDTKRRKMDIKLESEDANFTFPKVSRNTTGVSGAAPRVTVSDDSKISTRNTTTSTTSSSTANGVAQPRNANNSVNRVVGVTRSRSTLGGYGKRLPPVHQGPITLTSQLSNISRDGKVQLQIICQPEQQHRARYQTEGSRGAVKDRTGNGFPIVRLVGYDKPALLQVFIGTDLGRVAPHMFYQACRVSGKNSTPCIERKVDGTIVIEVDMDPSKDMLVTCDCVGILKERNVDVEHRFPQAAGMLQGRSKKKSTRCRMVFRTSITLPDGTTENLQVCSQPIVCTQPPGIPEICKKSLTSCPCTGGLELFILGKNLLKDTRILFQLDDEDLSNMEQHWECSVIPDKEFLQQTHLVCVVPPYARQDLRPTETVTVKLYAVSSGKTSEPHTFLYTAASSPPEPSVGKVESSSPPLVTSRNEPLSTSPTIPIAAVNNNSLISQSSAVSPNFLANLPQSTSQQHSPQPPSDSLKNDPSPPPVSSSAQVTPVMMWATQQTGNCQNSSADVMMPPPNLVASSLLNRRSSSNHQLIIPDSLKSEVIDENSGNSMLSDNSLQSMPTPNSNSTASTSPIHQFVSENSRDSTSTGLLRSVPSHVTPSQETVSLLGVVDLMRNQHPLTLITQHQNPFTGIHEQSGVKVLNTHHISKDTSPILQNENTGSGTLSGVGVGVDLRMKHHEYETLSNFTTTPAAQPLPNQSSQSIEKYFNHIESTAPTVKESDQEDSNFVDTMQQHSVLVDPRPQDQSSSTDILAPNAATAKLDALVNSAVESHQMDRMVAPLQTVTTSPGLLSHVPEVDALSTSQSTTRTSPPIPVKTMLLEALMPSPVVPATGATNGSTGTVISEPLPEESLMTTINAALLPSIQEPIVTDSGISNSTVNVSVHNQLQGASEPIPQIQGLTQQDVEMQQQVQQVEQVVAHAQQQVEQVVAQVQQQAAQTVQQAQQQVMQQVVQHAQVVQQAVQQVEAVRQVQAVPEVQQAVQQATQEVVQQAVQQATHEVVQQVQAVQQAVQQAQAAQAMQQAVQQDIGSMLNQPAGFVAEASSALASGAAQEPSQQRLTNAAEQAITNVITNATQDIINNRPISTTTAHAIIATKNILNSVATQSAQLMNTAMEGILPKSPSNAGTVAEQVSRKSSANSLPVAQNRSNNTNGMSNAVNNSNGQVSVVRKAEDAGGMLPQELTSMSEHDLLSYINPSCFDQGAFLM
ncbi:nuclear factor of activated T-cells 5-like isoform X1 [Cotesia glomerata]|uniref:nuclear factor of activated T-cells 5-like isoform X1 n=1 Tax=Cotesia glomerata TaxID=32391 RepID=UPI001D01B1FA|nr:nuclear factor of activated T-cells 5-like isoform X1 [Cotesia glomerata]